MKSKLKALYRLSCNLVDTPAVILLYHRVIDLSLDPQQLAVSPANFNDQIAYLKEHYHLLSFDEFADIITRKRKMPKRSAVVSFDDGYVDNLTNAVPILERHNAQAVFYVATATLDTRKEFWWDELERIFLLDHALPASLEYNARGQSYAFTTATHADRASVYDRMHPIVKDCAVKERNALMDKLVQWAGLTSAGRESHRVMRTDEVQAMAQSRAVVIAAHTHNHPKLSVCTPADQRADIALSKKRLEDMLSRRIDHFSYPFGSKIDYTPQTVQICRDLGFKTVCANYHSQVHSWHSPLELPRMLVRNWPVDVFKEKIHTFFRF